MRALTWQLLLILALAVVVPLVPVALTARALLDRSIGPWLATDLTDGARAGLAVTRAALEQEKRDFEEAIRAASMGDPRASAGAPLDTLASAEIAALPQREQREFREWATRNSRWVVDSTGADPAVWFFPRIAVERFTLQGREQLLGISADPDRMPVAVVFHRPLPPELVAAAEQLAQNVQLVETLRRERATLLRGMLATFLVVYGVILILVLLAGVWIASRITRPMRALAAGIERVAQGDLTTRVPETAGGEAGRLIAAFNDMVARLRVEQEERLRLERLEAWRQMSRRLAHEIKNPLTPIQLAAQQLEESYRGDDAAYASLVRQAGAIIREEVARLRELATGFSTLARSPEPAHERVDVAELLAEVARLYGEERVRVSADAALAVGGRMVAGDREALRRALMNLVGNALDAQAGAGRDGPVEMRLDSQSRAVEIHVLDRGPGVAAEERHRIFEPDVTTKPGGLGLGLAIVEATAVQHGGSIEVRDRDGGGADFVLRLPLASEGREGKGRSHEIPCARRG